MQVMTQADAKNTTYESEVLVPVEAIKACKKHHGDQGEGQSTKDLWGDRPASPVSPGTQPDPILEALDKIKFPAPSDPVSPISISAYTSFPTRAPSSTFRPLFSSIPTRPRGSRVNPVEQSPVVQSVLNGDQTIRDTTDPPPVDSPEVVEIPPPLQNPAEGPV